MVDRVHVDLGSRGYDIVVGERLLAGAGEYIAPIVVGERVFIVADETVARLYLHRLTGALDEAKIRARTFIVKPGEGTKTMAAFGDLMEQMLEQKPSRRTVLIALGGGVVGDLTGFAASTLLRGVDFIQIPTTLLAQVDSSVGGKTGINSRYGKNLIGSFHQPKLVLIDTATLTSLPRRELMAGYAEMLKYAMIGDTIFFAWLEQNAAAMLAGDGARLAHGIVTSCKAKAAVVAQDEKESGARALLNFGHTFAHALEAETGFSDKLLHGEAVAIGMILALRLSVAMGRCPPADLDRVMAHYQAVGLPTAMAQDWDVEKLMEHFSRDKKAKDGAPTFILARSIGQAYIENNVDIPLLTRVLAQGVSPV